MSEETNISSFCPLEIICSRFFSSEAGKHLLNARKELLLAVKSVIEREIERTDKMKREGKGKKAQKVEVT
jgi:hypothetical protein